ncbi:nitrite/sulfite reductase [Clostridium sp. 'White wine YQ']|uniref:nitrite/sulfite reductase n=1 Tax=Clostridium sp. 'White wine YQ' TaxID=3027474 RepID=UPI0023653199|nr:nitrite/sulfite reductase [Clostridium sp. 'White wine YQ']MDD7794413.1 nitrite/sulfite reductase [Clostridium sp. 'White wine YQ']
MSYNATWSEDPKINEVEEIKLEKDGLDIIETIIQKYSKEGYNAITPEDMNRFKWAGVYEQKPRNGYFMIRVRINSGIMTASQATALAEIARDYGRGIANVTTRGAIQFHWIKVEDLPGIFEKLKACGLSSYEACGDCPRTIVGNPLSGIDRYELMDTTEIVEDVNNLFLLNKDFSNLPRKFKVSISSSTNNAAHAQINDISFTPATKNIDEAEVIGFHVWVGGGLSAMPHLAQKLNIFVRPEEVKKITEGVCTIFRDYGYREKRTRARLKFLVADWGVEKFQAKLEEIVGKLESQGEDKLGAWNSSYYFGVHPQKQDGKSYIGINLPLGEIYFHELLQLAEISEKYGDQKLRTTLSQNIIISGICNEEIKTVVKKDIFKNLSPEPNTFIGHTVACTGKEYCNLALVETKELAKKVTTYLDLKIKLDTPIRIHFTGCPNSCGQKHIADISLQGAIIKTEKGNEDAFTVWLGGTLSGEGKFAQSLNRRVKATEVHEVLEKIILFFKENKLKNESFNDFVDRVGISAF